VANIEETDAASMPPTGNAAAAGSGPGKATAVVATSVRTANQLRRRECRRCVTRKCCTSSARLLPDQRYRAAATALFEAVAGIESDDVDELPAMRAARTALARLDETA
jgi:hypothetical protein